MFYLIKSKPLLLYKNIELVNAGVLKLGVATLFRVAKYFLRIAKIFLSHHSTLDSLEFVAF